jgi:asparagine synthetase B (glutamine-hydrolysing)
MEDEIEWALDLQDEPLAVMAFYPLALLIKRAKDYGKVLLTGDGADEVFYGYGKPHDWVDPTRGRAEYRGGDCSVVVGPPSPSWLSPWGQWAVGHCLLGHMFTKLDRASAEQGVEVRCPLIDWDLISFVRSLPPQQVFVNGKPKGLLKAELEKWPRWFVHRPKIGFTYHLRWAWATRRFAGLRELVTQDTLEAFQGMVPEPLRSKPSAWTTGAVIKNFDAAWKLLVWSQFRRRLKQATQTHQSHVPESRLAS